MNRDTEGLLREMIQLKAIVDQLAFVFHKISVNPNAGEQFANPVEVRNLPYSAPQLLTHSSGARDMPNSPHPCRNEYQRFPGLPFPCSC
jgi:hypothetical protein